MKNKIALFAAAAAVVASFAPTARAEDLQVAGPPPSKAVAASTPMAAEIGFYFFDSRIALNNTLHAVDGGMPDALDHKHLRLQGVGTMPGGEMRVALMPRLDPLGRARFGFGIGIMGVSNMGVASDALPSTLTIKPGSVWGARFTGFIGHEFGIGRRDDVNGPGRHAWLYPYVDLLATGSIVETKVDLNVQKLGFVGTTTLDAYAFSIGPRAGVNLPLGGNVSLDVGGFASFYGSERYGGYAGFSVITP